MFNDWAVKNWEKIISEGTTLEVGTYLVTSIIPYTYHYESNSEILVCVDLDYIRGKTKFAKEGCDIIVEKGYGKWLEDKTKAGRDANVGYTTLILGTSKNYMRDTYYFQTTNRLSTAIKPRVGSFNRTTTTTTSKPKKEELKSDIIDLTETIQKLDTRFKDYKVFLGRVKSSSKAEKIHTKIKKVIDKVIAGKQLTELDILSYLDCINAMYLDWMDVPSTYQIKAKQMAKPIAIKYSGEDIINGIPYFVEHYPHIAKEGYEETNIYMLNFHFGKLLLQMKKVKPSQPKNTFKNDEL